MNRHGFLFLEGSLITLTAMTGIIAAALFPSMTSYLARSRDAARMSHLKDISVALSAYYADKEEYPSTDSSGCIPQILDGTYLARGIPVDPTVGRISSGCDGTNGTYAYQSLSQSGVAGFAIGADMETLGNSEHPLPIATSLYESADEIQQHLEKGSGKYYILTN